MESNKVFPAYAGVIPLDIGTLTACTGVPRVCGGDPKDLSYTRRAYVCSPRMRG